MLSRQTLESTRPAALPALYSKKHWGEPHIWEQCSVQFPSDVTSIHRIKNNPINYFFKITEIKWNFRSFLPPSIFQISHIYHYSSFSHTCCAILIIFISSFRYCNQPTLSLQLSPCSQLSQLFPLLTRTSLTFQFQWRGRMRKNDMKIIFPVLTPCFYRTLRYPHPHLTSLPGILSLSIQPSYPCSSSCIVITLFPSNQLSPNWPQLGQMLATPQTKEESYDTSSSKHSSWRLRPLPAIGPHLLCILLTTIVLPTPAPPPPPQSSLFHDSVPLPRAYPLYSPPRLTSAQSVL